MTFLQSIKLCFYRSIFLETVIWLFCRVICWWFSEKMYTDYIAWYKGFQSQKMCYLCQICNDLKTGQDFESIEIEIFSNDKIKFKPQNESIGNLLKPIHYEINFRFCKLEVQITSWGVSKKKNTLNFQFLLFGTLQSVKQWLLNLVKIHKKQDLHKLGLNPTRCNNSRRQKWKGLI